MNTSLRAPAASASSAAYWISGLSTMGSISLGLALVAGRKRVPRPATGNTAVLISFVACFATADLLRHTRAIARAPMISHWEHRLGTQRAMTCAVGIRRLQKNLQM